MVKRPRVVGRRHELLELARAHGHKTPLGGDELRV
jgi:hypothetical protein